MTKKQPSRKGTKNSRKTIRKAPAILSKKALLAILALLLLASTVILKQHSLFVPTRAYKPGVNVYLSGPKLTVASEAASQKDKVLLPRAKPTPTYYGRAVKVPILMFHYIGRNPNPADKARYALSVSPDLFESEIKYLIDHGYRTIDFQTLYGALKGQAVLPPKPVMLTFDDGYIDFYVNAFPILRQYGAKAVVFIPTGLMDQGYYLLWSQIKEMEASRLVDFEAHTVNHSRLTSLPIDQMRYQLSESKKKLEEELGRPVNFMAYPYGATNNLVEQEAKNAGFLAAAGTWPGNVESESLIYNIPRLRIDNYVSLEQFAKLLR